MEKIDMAALIQDALARFSRNRIGDKPPVSLILSPTFAPVPWRDHGLSEFIRFFLYETLVSSDPDGTIEVSLRQRLALNDLSKFLALRNNSWAQLRVAGRGLRVNERFVEDLFADVGYRCDERLGVEGSSAQLAIFGPVEGTAYKLVFCLEMKKHRINCDLLIPVEAESAATDGLLSTDSHKPRLIDKSSARHSPLTCGD
jgi:hypothetical protein